MSLESLALAAVLGFLGAEPVGPPSPTSIERPISEYLNRSEDWPVVEETRPASFQGAARRDSLKNGALAGALIAGIGTGAFIGWLCANISEEGDGPCWKPTLVWAGIGAGAGALLGAGIDALFQANTRAYAPASRPPRGKK
jgi:hypothetical protein